LVDKKFDKDLGGDSFSELRKGLNNFGMDGLRLLFDAFVGNTTVGANFEFNIPLSTIDSVLGFFGFEEKGLPDMGFSVSLVAQGYFHPQGADLGFTFSKNFINSGGINFKTDVELFMSRGGISDLAGSSRTYEAFWGATGVNWKFNKNGIYGSGFSLGLGYSVGETYSSTTTWSIRKAFTEDTGFTSDGCKSGQWIC